jgi:hypothetical protein
LGEGFVPQAFIELWIRRSHVGKTVLVHRTIPTLIDDEYVLSESVDLGKVLVLANMDSYQNCIKHYVDQLWAPVECKLA